MRMVMKFVVLFTDDPAADPDIRRRYMPEHLRFLERNALKVRAAGPVNEPDGRAAGGIWLVEANEPMEVDALVRDDPFWSTGLRKSVRVLVWGQVFADGRRLLAG